MSKSSQTHEEAQVESDSLDPDTDSESKLESIASNNNSVGLEQQMVFGDDGDLEPEGESVETSLEAFGAEVDHSEGSRQVAKPSATRFGVDDRAQVPKRQNSEESDQHSLFANVESDQQTLGGDNAANRCLFGNQDNSDDSDNTDDEESS